MSGTGRGEVCVLAVGAGAGAGLARLGEALRGAGAERGRGRVRVLRALSPGQAGAGTGAADLVVLALDTSSQVCVEWTRQALTEIHPNLLAGRTILLNATGLPFAAMSINPESLLALSDNYDLPIFSGNIMDDQQCQFLARRILTYLDTMIGTETGIPNLNVFLPSFTFETQNT